MSRHFIRFGRPAAATVLLLGFVMLTASAQQDPDSLIYLEGGPLADSAWVPIDSLAGYDVAAGQIDSLLPDFVGFGEGEKLVYAIQYGIVNAGEATLEIRNIAIIDSTPCYNIVSNARTNDVFSVFYKVRDRYVSLMDTTELVSLRYEKHLREGNYRNDRYVVFDQKNHVAYYEDKAIPIAPRTQDVLSAMYYVRTLPLDVGHAVALANHTDGKNYPLVVKVLDRERIKVEAGTFDCIVVEPFLRYPGIFKQKGRVKVWVTDDRYRIPVLVKSKVVIGEVSAVLKDFRLADKFRND
ncbi:MAG: DUF3108 domain-containing protein [Candidatus Latescibacterota bacterium]|nr:MAG: DUF3108 domain-containing protein [Candidatus Latescibacterota bacterium]